MFRTHLTNLLHWIPAKSQSSPSNKKPNSTTKSSSQTNPSWTWKPKWSNAPTNPLTNAQSPTNSSTKSPAHNCTSASWTITWMETATESQDQSPHNKPQDSLTWMTGSSRTTSKPLTGSMAISPKNSIGWWSLPRQPNSTWPHARLKPLSPTKSTTLVSPALKGLSSHSANESAPASKDTSSTKTPTNASVSPPSSPATKPAPVSACALKTNPDGTQSTRYVKPVPSINL